MKLAISLSAVLLFGLLTIAHSSTKVNFESLFEDAISNDLEKYKSEFKDFWRELIQRFPEGAWLYSQKFPHRTTKNNETENLISDDSMVSTESPDKPIFHISRCNIDLKYTLDSLKQKWAFQMLDSVGKIPSGISRGALTWPGNFDGCHEVVAPASELRNSTGFKGKYCTLAAATSLSNMGVGIQIGLCVPNSCSVEDLKAINTTIYKYLDLIPFVNKWVQKHSPHLEVSCEPDSNKYDTATIICVVLFSIICAIVVSVSSIDIYWIYSKSKSTQPADKIKSEVAAIEFRSSEKASPDEIKIETSEEKHDKPLVEDNADETVLNNTKNCCTEKVKKILLCFSVFKNAPSILDTKTRKGQMNCLHGIRFISLTWVILGHTYVMAIAEVDNKIDIMSLFKTFWFQAVQQATFSVDTFFLLSGFLLTYLFLKGETPMTAGKWVYFYIHRYIRLTPVYMMMLFVNATWWNYMGDGPFWIYQNRIANACTRSWWYNLLYINNFKSVTDMCMGWSWYLANDMQFYVISPLFLIPLKSMKYRVLGLVTVGVLLLSSWIATGVISTINDFPIMFNGIGDAATDPSIISKELWDEFDYLYDKPHTRIGPYLIGVLLGFVMHEVNRKQLRISKWVVISGWLGAVVCNLLAVYGLYNTNNMGTEINALYNVLARSGWAVGVAWLIFACLTGNGGPVDSFLSWNVWFPLSRLTYCAYLVHPMIMYWYFPIQRTPYYFSQITTAVLFLGFLSLSYGTAFLVSLFFEAPVIKLEKVLREGKA